MVLRKGLISLVVMGILLILSSVSILEAVAPLWNFKIENMTDFAMSRNGQYVIVACETGPLCEKGQYYIFDQYGNTVNHGCIEGEITVVDIADNSAFFIGTRTGYYFSSSMSRKLEDLDMGNVFQSVSISENGEIVIVGTDNGVFIFDGNGIRDQKELGRSVSFTAISASGDVAIAGTSDRIFLYDKSTNSWEECPTNGTILDIVISDDGRTIACSMMNRFIWIMDSELNRRITLGVSADPRHIDITSNGKYVVCGSRQGDIFYFDASGKEIWSYNTERIIEKVSISADGSFVAALSQDIVLFNASGEKLQDLRFLEPIYNLYLSNSGDILSYVSSDELFCVELSKSRYTLTYEYTIPSRRSIPLENQLVEVWSHGDDVVRGAVVADIDGDANNEIICSLSRRIEVLDSEGKVLWTKQLAYQFQGLAALDLTGDFMPEIIITPKDNRMGLQVFNGEGKELASHEFYSRWYSEPLGSEWTMSIIPYWSNDIDNDGFNEVICVVYAGYALKPRGFYAFEYPSFKEEWYYPVATPPVNPNFVDINGDEKIEIIAGSNAPCNGRRVGDTDDCYAYVYAVTLEGKELWTKQIGRSGFLRADVAVADLNGDGTQEIVGGGWSHEGDWGALFVLDSKGNYVLGEGNEYDSSVYLEGVADLDNDGDLEILVSSSPSTFIIYDHDLRETRRRNISMPLDHLTRAMINDIDADGRKEIILISDDPKLLILNADLEEEWNKVFPGYDMYLRAIIADLNKCKNYLLIFADKLHAYTYSYNPDSPCVPWIVAKEEKINEIEVFLEEASKYLEQRDMEKAAEYVSQAEEVYLSIKDEGGLESYYEEIENMKNAIEAINWMPLAILAMILAIISLIILRKSVRKHVAHDLMVLSLEKRDKTLYQIALESVRGTIHPVKSTRTIDISPEMRSEMIARIDCASKVINTFLSLGKEPKRTIEELGRMGTVIYKNFIPRDFASKFVHHYIVLEVEDVQIPWELMYDGEFFALKYAVSRRIKSEKVPEGPKKRKREKKALLIADPTERLPGAVRECEYLKDHLQGYFTTTYLPPEKARKVDIMYHFSQRYDIIHYAGELDKNNCLPVYKGELTCAEIERTLEGSPVVFINGCCSAKAFSYDIEGLAKTFLERGALSFIGSLWGIHDRTAAEIAAEFYKNCLRYPVGEALRLSRKKYYSIEDITWAAFVMYGDPTLNLFK